MGSHKIYGFRGPWGLTAVLQLFYELRHQEKLLRVDGRESKALQEVPADLKTRDARPALPRPDPRGMAAPGRTSPENFQ